jgi:hypothetical protein
MSMSEREKAREKLVSERQSEKRVSEREKLCETNNKVSKRGI